MNVASIALPVLLILVDLLCFDRYKIDYSHWASKSLRIETSPAPERGGASVFSHRFAVEPDRACYGVGAALNRNSAA